MLGRTSGECSNPLPPKDALAPSSRREPAGDEAPRIAEPAEAARAPLSDVEFLKQVGRGVASVYSDILGQPMPDRLIALLKRLEEEEDAPKSGNRSHL